jgi:tetratricopeptide (TPR) repeat protein
VSFFSLSKYRAARMHRQAQMHSAQGDDQAALELYEKCLTLDRARPTTLYNIGLIYKYRGDWEKSLEFNARAYDLSPSDEASRWNLAIAATALRRWSVARRAWRDNGLVLADIDEPISMDFGQTPIRLNPKTDGEVVWGRRIDPVRAVIESVPLPESRFRCNDVVLHDGAATGYRVIKGREYPVFNVLELFEPSKTSTYVAHIRVTGPEQIEWLARLAETTGVVMEDWTGNVRTLCSQCSEGTPHESHDTEGQKLWNTDRRIGFGCSVPNQINEIIAACKASATLEIFEVALALSA